MIVYYSGPTEFTHKFVGKLGLPSLRIPHNIKEASVLEVSERYVLFCPTYERRIVRGKDAGKMTYIPRQVGAFLSNADNRSKMDGVVGFGNMNFNLDYARAADDISARTGVPVIGRVELSGNEEDVRTYKEGLIRFWQTT